MGPKVLITIGGLLVVAGVIWHFGGKYLPFGKLPGDITIERENMKIYFPLATSIVLSVLLSLIVYLVNKFR